MATLKIQPIHMRVGYSKNTGQQGTEAANQTFKVGNLIYPVAGAYTATPAGATAATAKNRVAMSNGQNVAAPTRRAEFVDPNQAVVFEVTAGGAVSTTGLIQAGLRYGYAIDGTTGLGYLNLADTTNLVFEIQDSKPVKGVIGDTNITVSAVIIPAAR